MTSYRSLHPALLSKWKTSQRTTKEGEEGSCRDPWLVKWPTAGPILPGAALEENILSCVQSLLLPPGNGSWGSWAFAVCFPLLFLWASGFSPWDSFSFLLSSFVSGRLSVCGPSPFLFASRKSNVWEKWKTVKWPCFKSCGNFVYLSPVKVFSGPARWLRG